MTERQGRRRQRSLRVPVDDVPRKASETDTSAELEMLVEPEAEIAAEAAPPRPRTVPPPPPRMSEPEAETRSTDPGTTEAEADVDLGAPMALAPRGDLEPEATQVAVEIEGDPSPLATGDLEPAAEIPGEPTREITLAEAETAEPPPPPPRPRTVPPPSPPVSERPPPEPTEARVSSAMPSSSIPSSSIPSSPMPSSAMPPSQDETSPGFDVAPVSSPGIIVVQRTIAIGVGTPTFTTTAEERASAPPDPPLHHSSNPPPPEPDVALDITTEAPAAPPTPQEFDEELAAEEIEEASSPSIERPRSVPPPAGPKGAPPPPPSGGPPVPPTGQRPPKPPPAKPAPPAAPPAAAAAAAAMEADTAKRQRRKWWEELFNDDYLRTVPIAHPKVIRKQVDFMESRLGLSQGSTVLDVGCGLGLHAIELTRRGVLAVGLDLSLPMLSRAADEARGEGLKINFVQGDMREMSFDGAFDAVISWGTSFGYFDDDANKAVIERFHRALKPGGLLLLDVVNRDHTLRSQPNNCWFQGDGCVVMEETQLNYITSRLMVKRQVMLDDGRQLDTAYSIRLYSLHELGQILHLRGFRVVEVSGLEATPGVFFGGESPRLLIVAERRPDTTPSKAPPGTDQTGQMPAIKDEPIPPAAPTGEPPTEGS